jgi:ribosomal protein S18 acetylase RimI-like enzyme
MPSKQQSLSSRNYRDLNDLVAMQDFLMQGRSQTDDWHYPHVGELQFSFFMVLCHLDPTTHVHLWHDRTGSLVAYAILGEDPLLDWHVSPQLEWAGLEQEIMAWGVDLLSQLRARDPEAWAGPLQSGCRKDNPTRISFLESCGFRYSGEFAEVNMLRALSEPVPPPAFPSSFQVRALSEADSLHSRAEAQRKVWQPWSVGNVTDQDYSHFMELPGYHRDLDVVAVAPSGEVAAYVNGWIDPVNKIGDFGPLGALPSFRRLGLTTAVLLEGLHRMAALGMNRVCVSTTEGNEGAKALYASLGFGVVNSYLDFVKPEPIPATGAG